MSFHSNNFKRWIVVLECLITFFPISAIAQIDYKLVAGAAKLKVEVITHRSTPQECQFHPNSYIWGAEGECPQIYIWGMNVIVGGKVISAPLSAFADLANPNRLSVSSGPNKDDYSIIIGGGEAGTGYTAVFIVRDQDIISRKVFSNEFPTKAYEMTTYRWHREGRRRAQ